MRKLIIFFVLSVIFIASAYIYYRKTHSPQHRDSILLFGNVDVRQVQMGFRVEGRVETMLFEEGDFVAEGVKMAELDKQPYANQVLQAQANADSISHSLHNAEKLLQRRSELIGDGSISQEDYDNALSSREIYAANFKAAEAAKGIADTNFKDTIIFAPSAGTILTRIREPGSVVKPADPIYTLSILAPVWVRAFIAEPDLGLIYPGMPAEVYSDSAGGKVYKGHVGFISPVAEFTPKTVETTQLRTTLVYRLRIIADNPDRGLRQGMPVTVKLLLEETTNEPTK
ncbi:MAG: efflux RND transporter periplasmic adaptor subunit [Parachlamydiaceae bacterium]|nr:efflux RND transporter periplasmic adaptor subunit [Parachlamydiaceae bacterium]